MCKVRVSQYTIDGTLATAVELFVGAYTYIQSRYCFATRIPRRGSKQYLSYTLAVPTPLSYGGNLPLWLASPGARRWKRGAIRVRRGEGWGFSSSVRLVSTRLAWRPRQPSAKLRPDRYACHPYDPNFLHLLLRKAMHLLPFLPPRFFPLSRRSLISSAREPSLPRRLVLLSLCLLPSASARWV